jgi:hypothetical protein
MSFFAAAVAALLCLRAMVTERIRHVDLPAAAATMGNSAIAKLALCTLFASDFLCWFHHKVQLLVCSGIRAIAIGHLALDQAHFSRIAANAAIVNANSAVCSLLRSFPRLDIPMLGLANSHLPRTALNQVAHGFCEFFIM